MKSLPSDRILSLKNKTLSTTRYLSLDQAKIITRVYRSSEDLPVILKRANALAQSLLEIPISIDPEELIVGNRTPEIRAGVVFPEAGLSWLKNEIRDLQTRPQDSFNVRQEDITYFFDHIEPYWKGKTLEDDIYNTYGKEIYDLEKVVKINQKDHAQGHICPNVADWLRFGPKGLKSLAGEKFKNANCEHRLFYESVIITLNASSEFIKRYGVLAAGMAKDQSDNESKENLNVISRVCMNLSENPPSDLREAIQSVWFLFVILQMESNASSFSPGRMDQFLYPFYINDLKSGRSDPSSTIELIDNLFIKFNQIVYMRNMHSAEYFAGFPTGFNITIGGQTAEGKDATNELTYLLLLAQDHIRLPQPNLTARIHSRSPERFIDECSRVIGLGTGMPQIVNDESIIPALQSAGLDRDDVMDYVLVGCVEISTQGNFLGWSDAAMFNMVKVLELTLNDGKCLISGNQIGLKTGSLPSYSTFSDLESALQQQLEFFLEKTIKACEVVDGSHQKHLPSPFLSSVIADCLHLGVDVTSGGAKYNMSGIQAIQVANIADSLAAIKILVYDNKLVTKEQFHEALVTNFENNEILRQKCINHVPKFGNDVPWVDLLGAGWVKFFSEKLKKYKNIRGGNYQMGLYTVSAHLPMGKNVGATPDGRLSGAPLADGGLSPMYGLDKNGPTAVLNSVARIPSNLAANGTLLNMKFLPSVFSNENDREKFNSFLKAFVRLPVHHVQFNVITAEELIRAKSYPQAYRGLTIRVAGYTAFFTDLNEELQNEIITRTTHGGN